ncbi:MAG: PspC domain-containing protein [Mycobacteriaceae bacterium]|uniref:PspC domain-containing protein n=1 Tax=Corynebacterium sp. TaxID=1720 RepID=UPI003F966EAC
MSTNIETTIREMWTTRPVRFPRSQSQRTWFFGVCEGIAVRYQVSPLLIRLLFVLLTFTGGVGLWVYGAALLVFRRYSVPKTPFDVLVRSERDPRFEEDRSVAIGTLITGLVFLVLGGIFSGGITLTGLIVSAAVTGVVWWLLHERTPVPPAGLLDRDDVTGVTTPAATPTPTAPAAAPASEQDAPTIDLGEVSTASGFEPPRRQPPSWDPLGTAPFAWDLPDPGIPADEESGTTTSAKKKRTGLKVFIIGLVLAVVLGITGLFSAVFSSWGGFSTIENDRTQGTFVGGPVQVQDLPANYGYEYTMSSQQLDFADAQVDQDSTIDLQATMSSVIMTFPETTSGPSYRVEVNCPQSSMSDIDCDSFNGTQVRGSGDRDDDTEHTVTVNVNATMSEVRFEQFS